MAETYLGLPVGQAVEVGSWDALPEAIRAHFLGVGNRLKGTPWTLAELESLKGMTSDQMIKAGYLPYNDSQIQSMIDQAKNVQSYYIDPATKEITINQTNRNNFDTYSYTSGSALKPGQISRTNKMFQNYWGSAGNTAFGINAQGQVVQTNKPITGNESLEELIANSAAGLTTETGTILTRGVSFTYDKFGNILSATDSKGQPVSVDQAKQIWDRFFIDNPDQLAQTQAIRAAQGLPTFVPGKLTGPTGPTPTLATGPVPTTATSTIKNPYLPGTEEFKAFGERESAYNLLYSQMAAYGLQSLVEPLKNLVLEGVSPSEFTIRLRDTNAYKQRFAANQARIQKGLRALSEAEYIGLEDQYQDVMRRYGLPTSYYQRGDLGRQEGFEKFIAGDVSPVELEDRIQTAYNRVINANPEVGIALRNFYPSITNGDILAYAMDPDRALQDIQRKITAAEIGGAAVQAGLTTNESDAEYLARYGITKEQAQQGYRTISGYLPRAQQLSDIYGKQVQGGPYTQASAEREVFNVPGAAEEERKRKQITSLEEAAFSGRSGLTGGALARERAGQF